SIEWNATVIKATADPTVSTATTTTGTSLDKTTRAAGSGTTTTRKVATPNEDVGRAAVPPVPAAAATATSKAVPTKAWATVGAPGAARTWGTDAGVGTTR